jgi:hypothetical protein
MQYAYRDEVIRQLLEHGIRPTSATAPERVRALVNDLYCYELRQLRARLLRQEFPKREYAARVIELRQRYALLSTPIQHWLAPGSPT